MKSIQKSLRNVLPGRKKVTEHGDLLKKSMIAVTFLLSVGVITDTAIYGGSKPASKVSDQTYELSQTPVVEEIVETERVNLVMENTSLSKENETKPYEDNTKAEIQKHESETVMKAEESKKTQKETKKNDKKVSSEEKKEEAPKETKPASVISYTDEDYNNFLRIVEAEATGGDVKSKMLVANVIINRVKRNDFPGTVTGVIYQGNGEQFQPIMDGRFYSVSITGTTIEAVNRALAGEDYSMGAVFFASTAYCGPNSWHSTHLTRLFEYGGHVFFAL